MEFAPDGIAFDEAGNLWVVCPRAHALGVIAPAGAWEIAVRDPAGCVLNLPTNICFGGPTGGRRTSGTSPGPRSPPSACRTPGWRSSTSSERAGCGFGGPSLVLMALIR